MKNLIKSFAVLTAALLAFVSCQQEKIDSFESSVSHTLKFVAVAPETKTVATIDEVNKTVEYAWSNSDAAVDKFQVWQINEGAYTAAESVSAVLESGVMLLEANFKGEAKPGSQYVALFNKGVQADQGGTDNSYDQNSDVLVSEVVTYEDVESETLELCFARKNAFALMTAKGIEGAYIGKAIITADQVIAAEFSVKTGKFAETGSETIVVADQDDETMPISEIVDNEADVFFSILPVESAKLSVSVVTVDEDGEFQSVYDKTFAEGKSISFSKGDVRPFNISMNKAEGITLDLTKQETTAESEDKMTWDRTFVSVTLTKGTSTTNANNYCPPTQNSTRLYNGQVLTVSPKLGVPVKEIVFESTTENYAKALQGSTWTNATAVVSGTTVIVVPEDGAEDVSAKISATTGQTSIKISYGKSEPIKKRSITIDTNIENGSVSASETSDINPGTEIILTATPASGYVLDAWNVTNAATSEGIDVVNNRFTMPNADVNVSAAFKVASMSGSVVINATNSGVTGSYADKTFNVDGFGFGFTQWMKSTNIQAKKSIANSLYNTTAFPSPIKKITFVQTGTARALTVFGGTSEKPSNQVTSPTTALTMVFDFSGKDYTYFTMTTSGNAVYFDSITIEYEAVAKVTSVTISGDATTKSYKAGDKFDITGLVATAKYDDNSTKDVTADAKWDVTPETLTAGTTSVSVKATYKEVASADFTVSGLTVVEPAVLSSISIKTTPSKVTYTEGETFNPAGLVITRHYSDATSDDYVYAGHTSEFSFNPALSTALATTDTKVTITYQGKTVDQAITVNAVPALSTMDEIFAAATAAGSTATDTKITFNNWVISGVKGSNAYLTDNNCKGLIIYTSDHGFAVGDILSGTVDCKIQLYNGSSELTALTSATTGLTVAKGGDITPASIAIKDLSGVNTGAVITFAELSYNGTEFTDGTNIIKPYNTFFNPTLVSGKKYSVTGVYIQYRETREIAPRTADDIVEKAATTYTVSVAPVANGSLSVDYAQATEGQTVTITAKPDSGYKLKAGSVKVTRASSGTVPVTSDKSFTMPAEAVIVSAEFEEISSTDPITVSMTSFNSVTGNVGGDTNVSYKAEKGNASTAPAVNNNEIRIYQNGGTLTITAESGYKLQSVTIGSSMATTIDYSSAGASKTGVSLAANKTITASEINDTQIIFTCKGTDKNSRLYLNSLSVTYVAN